MAGFFRCLVVLTAMIVVNCLVSFVVGMTMTAIVFSVFEIGLYSAFWPSFCIVYAILCAVDVMLIRNGDIMSQKDSR